MNVKASFMGRLGADAELINLNEGVSFLNFRVAVDERVRGQQVTTWINVNADYERFKKLQQYLTKGKMVFVSGNEQCSLFTAKSTGTPGIDRKVNADTIEFVSTGQKPNGDGQTESQTQEMSTGGLRGNAAPMPKAAPAAAEVPDDDLPF